MINNTDSKKVYKVQLGVTEYPIGFPFQSNPDGSPQLFIAIADTPLVLNHNCKLSEDKNTLILTPTEEETTAVGFDYNTFEWMKKWVDEQLLITRDIPFVQESDYQVGRISPEQIEKDFDLSVMRDQILSDKIGEHTTDVSEELESLHSYIDFVQQTHENDVAEIDAELAKKATKTELENAVTTLGVGITGNAEAIQKTRDDMDAEDGRLQTQITAQAAAITTNKNDIDELGDDVAEIQAKIPESASGTNHLITKQQLLDEEMDIREDMNQSDSELQTQITAQAAAIATLDSEKLDKNQGSINAGKVLTVGEDGLVVPTAGGTGGGLQAVSHDNTLSGAGTDESPLGLAEAIKDEIADKAPKETVEALTAAVSDIITSYVKKSGDTMTGGLTLPELTVSTAEGTFTVSVVAGVVTIATNNGLDIASHVKFDHAPTTDDNTTWANALDTSLVRKAQVATALANIDALPDQTGNAGKFLKTDGTTASWEDVPPSVTITLKEYDE